MRIALLLLAVGLGPFVAARPLHMPSETDLIAIMNAVLQSSGKVQNHGWPRSNVESQGLFGKLFRTVGGALCKAGYDPSAVAEALLSLNSNKDEAEIQGFKKFLKKFGSNLCDYITEDNGQMLQPTAQGWPVLGAATQRRLFEWPQMKKTASNAELQGFLNTFKKFGSALCRAAYDGNNPNVLAQHFLQLNRAEIEGVTDFLKRFGANLCDYVKEDDGGLTEQDWAAPFAYNWPKIELSSAEMQGFFKNARKVGSALCRAALDRDDPTAVAQSLGLQDEVEIQKFTDFLSRFGSNLCDYITKDNGRAGTEQVVPIMGNPWNTIHFNQQEENLKAQGFLKDTAKKIGNALCKAALDHDNPTAVVQSLGLKDEVEIQSFTDFLKRFGTNLCDYVTEDSGRGSNPSKQGVSIMSTTDQVETQGFKDAAKKIGSALCRAALDRGDPAAVAQSLGLQDEVEIQKFTDFLERFGTNLCNYVTGDSGTTSNPTKQSMQEEKTLETQGLLNTAKKIGSALCRAAYDNNPAAEAESLISWGKLDKAEAQRFKDFLKSFGSNLCDYITQDGGSDIEAIVENDLASELMNIEE